jgi:DNA-binding CsgD family transcriptional regulator/hypothetical membrane protein
MQKWVGGLEYAVEVIRTRAGSGHDPNVADQFCSRADELVPGDVGSLWDVVLACEPGSPLMLSGAALDGALAGMGDFADLAAPCLTGHSDGVARLTEAAAKRMGLEPAVQRDVTRAARVHDLGRVAVSPAVWEKPGTLTTDQREQVRLHAYHTERLLSPSAFLSRLAGSASAHHERCDGSGYHRGVGAVALSPEARLLAAADAYHTMSEPRPHRPALPPSVAAQALSEQGRNGRLDAEAVRAVLEAAGQATPRRVHPAGLTDREVQVLGLLAHGYAIKQIGRRLGISTKTASRHVQNIYPKIGVSTRAAAAVFAMQHGLAGWGERPIADERPPLLASKTQPRRGDQEAIMNSITDSRMVTAARPDLTRWAAIAGIAGPVLFTVGFLTQEQLRRGEYDPISQVVSALEAGDNGWIQQVNFLVLGVLTMLFAAGLHRGLARSQAGIVGPAALFVSGVGCVLAALFPLNQDASGQVYDPGGHQVAGTLFFASSCVALLALSRRCAADPRWRDLSGWILVAGALAGLSFPLMGVLVIPDDAPLHDWAGLAQRLIVLLLFFPARIALAIRLRAQARGH